MNVRGSFLKNIISNWSGMGLSIVIAFAMTPYVIGKLGTTGYGFWALLQSIISYMFLLEFGVRSSMTRHFAKFLALKDDRQVNHIISTGLAIYLFVGALAVGVSVVLATQFDRLFIVDEMDAATIRWAVLLVGLSLALQFPAAVFESVQTGHQRFDLVNLSVIMSLLFRTGLTVWALEAGYGVRGLSWATFLSAVLLVIVNYLFARMIFPPLHVRFATAHRDTLRMLGHHSLYAFIMIGAMRFITDAGNVIVGAFAGTAMVSLYAVASSLTNYLFGVVSGISTTISPMASEYDAHGDTEGLKRLAVTGTKAILLVGLPILSTFIAGGDTFIRLWVGEALLGSYPPLVFLSVAWGMNILTLASSCTLIGLSRHRIAAWCVSSQAVLDVILSVILVRHYGVVGVAAGAMIASILINVPLQLHALRLLQIPVGLFVNQAVLRALIATMPFVVVLNLALRLFTPSGVVQFFLCVAIAMTGYLGALPSIGLSAAERTYLKDRMLQLKTKMKAVVVP